MQSCIKGQESFIQLFLSGLIVFAINRNLEGGNGLLRQLQQQLRLLEESFQQNHYDGISINADFEILTGTGNVMISMPHTTNHLRKGAVKYGEVLTGAIGLYLHQTTGCHCIYTKKKPIEDPNFDSPSRYKNDLAQYIKKNNVSLLIDLHGAALKWFFSVDLGTAKGQTIALDKLQRMISLFEQQGINDVVVDEVFTASNIATVTNYIHNQCSIDCVQVEINRVYRDLEDMAHTEKMVNALQKIILEFMSDEKI